MGWDCGCQRHAEIRDRTRVLFSMRKQELIHIHALLYELGEYIDQEGESPVDPFARYEEQPTRPQHLHRGKSDHLTAINRLLRGCCRFARASHRHTHTADAGTTSR